MEILLYSDSSGQPDNINTIKLSNGQTVTSFKGGISFPNSLCVLKRDYVVSALPNKSVLNVFELNRRGQQPLKVVTPGVVKCLCTSPDGYYIAAGIEEKVIIWETSSGELLNVLSRHYQDVTSLCFCNDSSYLVSSGMDGIICVWNVSCTINIRNNAIGSKELLYCWASHSLPVTHLCCSSVGGARSRIFSSSLDRTIKIHDTAMGCTLLTLVFTTGVTAFCIDYAETMLIAGGYDGSLTKVDLIEASKVPSLTESSSLNVDEIEKQLSNNKEVRFKGHSSSVTCMAINMDGSTFASGSSDQTIQIWDVSSGQCMRTIMTKEMVTNLLIMLFPFNLSSTNHKPSYIFPKLARAVADADCEKPPKLCRLDLQLTANVSQPHNLSNLSTNKVCLPATSQENTKDNLQNLKQEVKVLKDENKKLFHYAVNCLLQT